MAKALFGGLALVLLFLQGSLSAEDGARWFLGCYNESITDQSLLKPMYKELKLTPVNCVRLCVSSSERYKYALLRNGSVCICKADLDYTTNTSQTLCNISCSGDTNFSCGGINTSSVYSTALPVIISMTLNVQNQIKVNASVNATSKLSIKRPRNEVTPLQSIVEGNYTALHIIFEWYSDDQLVGSSQCTMEGNSTDTSFAHFFLTPGHHSVCVKGSNLFSSQEKCNIVKVLSAVSGLQLVGVYHGNVLGNISSTSFVETHETVRLKFRIHSGSETTFMFDFGDGSFPLTVVDNFIDSNLTCITAAHVFTKCGNFSVNVTASNALNHMNVCLQEQFKVRMRVHFENTGSFKTCIYTEVNTTTKLTAKIKLDEGCVVLFEWDFGDSSSNVTTTVPSVQHRFLGTQSKYIVTVTAYSELNREVTTIEVCVEEGLKVVILKPGGIVEVKTQGVLNVNISVPSSSTTAGYGNVRYHLHKGDGSDPIPGSVKSFHVIYEEPGRYGLFVDAYNKVSRIVSRKTVVSVLDPVEQLSIHHEGTTLVGKPTHLEARLSSGTNVLFHWSFGDGSENRTSTNAAATHAFLRRGRFKVTVAARNNISIGEEASMTIFVTNVSYCYPPVVKILGLYSGLVQRSKMIHLEASAVLNCSKAMELVYLWKVSHTSGSKESQLAVLNGVRVTEQVLIIPPCHLDYGSYIFQLEVRVKGTVLSTENKRHIDIGPSDLIVSIAGGTTRVLDVKNKMIIMDASASHDPDFPADKHGIGLQSRTNYGLHLRQLYRVVCFDPVVGSDYLFSKRTPYLEKNFSWQCHLLGNPGVSCLNSTRLPSDLDKNSSVFSFHGDWLVDSDDHAIEFEVTISKGVRKFTASQVLYLASKESHVLLVNCPQCDRGNISVSEELVLTGLCWSCQLDNPSISYFWQLYLVGKLDQSETYDCMWNKPNPDIRADNALPTTEVSSESKFYTTADRVPSTWTPTARPVTSQPTNPSAMSRSCGRISRGRICEDPDLPLAPTVSIGNRRGGCGSSGGWKAGTGHGTGSGTGFGSGSGTGSGSGSGSGTGSGSGSRSGSGSGFGWASGSGSGSGSRSGTGSGSGSRSGSGSGSGRVPTPPNFGGGRQSGSAGIGPGPGTSTPGSVPSSPGSGSSGRKTNNTQVTSGLGTDPTTAPRAPNNDHADGDPITIYDPRYTPRSAQMSTSILHLSRREMSLPVDQTTTGRKGRNLVLKGQFLRGGNTYMVAFLVSDRSNGMRGTTTVFFRTNRSPQCGTCFVRPSSGEAIKTSFQLMCSGWKVEGDGPLRYFVSRSIKGENDDREEVIYYGFKSEVSFVLPSGLMSFNYTVKIHVTLVDGQGSTRRFQTMSVGVTPPVLKEGTSLEEILLNETSGRHLLSLQRAGNHQGVRQFCLVLAHSLNRLGTVRNVSSKFYLRQHIREKLLASLQDLSITDKDSALETSLALRGLTNKPSELTARSLRIASNIIHNLGSSTLFKGTEKRDSLSHEFISSLTTVTSNLIEGSKDLVESFSSRSRGNSSDLRKEKILVSVTETTEKILKAKLSTLVLGEKRLEVNTSYVRVQASLTPSLSRPPLSLDKVFFQMPEELDSRLNGTSFAGAGRCFGTMMVVYRENPFPSEMYHTKVASLSISKCSGEEMDVQNLSSRIHLSIPNERPQIAERTRQFILKWNHVNTHIVPQKRKMINQSLYIQLKPLSPVPPGFVVKLTVSLTDNNHSSKNEHVVHTSSSFGGIINLYLGRHKLQKASSLVFARIYLEDTAYYRIKQVKSGPHFRYVLRLQWMGCFYWDRDKEEWLTDGCELAEESTVELLHCRCNHLTAFSGAFIYPPNSLNSKNLADIKRLKESPIALALVIAVLILYLAILVVCVKADRHDENKSGVVYVNGIASAAISQQYQISVETGHWFGAGTSANVFVVLHGEEYESDPIELKCDNKPLFERSSSDVFIVRTLENFGPIWKIHIWHDNEGKQPDWFLERVTVKDVKTGMKWIFDCHRWLAVHKGRGKIEYELLATTDDKTSFKKTVSRFSAQAFLDHHLWLSLIGRPSPSRFTRAQRLTCGLSLLMSFLFVNIAWYKPKTEVSGVLGPMDITLETVVVGLLCSLIVLPINLLWIFLFRYSRRRVTRRRKVQPIHEPSTEYTEVFASSVPAGKEDAVSILDHSLETLLYLKTMGQRRRWFQTTLHMEDVHSQVSSSGSYGFTSDDAAGLSSGLPSDGSSLGYNSGQDVGISEQPLSTKHPSALDPCEFPPDFASIPRDADKPNSSTGLSVNSSSPQASRPRGKFSLPHAFVYLAWFGCLVTATATGTLTVLYGVSFGWDMSVRWLQSLCFSCMESFFVSQPIIVLLVFFYVSCQSNTRTLDEDVDEGFEDVSYSALYGSRYTYANQGFGQETDEEEVDPALAVRRRQRYLKFLKPLPKSKVFVAREKCVRSKALWGYGRELLVFVVFFVVTCFLVASVQSPDVYRLNKTLKTTFLRSDLESPWAQPESFKESWKQIAKALTGNSVPPYYAPFTTLLRDTQSLLFGRTRITQYKTRSLTICRDLNRTQAINATILSDGVKNETMRRTFCYSTCDARHGSQMSVVLNQARAELEKQLKNLTDSEWISDCTQQITVEFTLYTPFIRAISAATLSVKASLIGHPTCDLDIQTFTAFFKTAEYGYFMRACKLLFVALYLYLLLHEFFLLMMSSRYFKSFRRIAQLATVILASMSVIVFIRWSVCLYALLREVETENQEEVFSYAKMTAWNQETLVALYSLLLFVLILHLGHLIRPLSFMMRIGRVLKAAVQPLLGFMVMLLVFVMTFAHPGFLLFSRLHSASSSFSDIFLLVISFFRLEGVSHYLGAIYDQRPLLSSMYFGLFLVGFCVVLRGLSAAVLLRMFLQARKPHFNLLANVIAEFVRGRIQSLMIRKKKRQRREELDSDEDEEDFDDEESEGWQIDAPFPLEYVFDELESQIEELSFRVNNLTGPDLLTEDRCYEDDLSCTDSDDVVYLYPTEQPHVSGGSGYESDHSNLSGALWEYSSSSSHDIACSIAPQIRCDGLPQEAWSAVLRNRLLYLGEEHAACEDKSTMSCSSCYEISGNNAVLPNQSSISTSVSDKRGGEIDRPECLDGAAIRTHSAPLQQAYSDSCLTGSQNTSLVQSSKTRTRIQELSSSSGNSLLNMGNDQVPVSPKTLYGPSRGCHGESQPIFPDTPKLVARKSLEGKELGSTPTTNASSSREMARKTSKLISKRTRGLFRSSSVHPSRDCSMESPCSPLLSRSGRWMDSGSSSSSEARQQPVWGLATSASERSLSVAQEHYGPEARKPISGLSRPSEGIIGDISMNKKLGTEVILPNPQGNATEDM